MIKINDSLVHINTHSARSEDLWNLQQMIDVPLHKLSPVIAFVMDKQLFMWPQHYAHSALLCQLPNTFHGLIFVMRGRRHKQKLQKDRHLFFFRIDFFLQ